MSPTGNKPTIYVLLTKCKTLSRSTGDAINEFRLYDRLSEIFDVYYNNDFFLPEKDTIGDPGALGPTRPYDYYYIRNNKNVFLSINGYKIAFAYPYDKEVFDAANAFFVYTDSWKRHLSNDTQESKKKLKNIYDGNAPRPQVPIINVSQSMDEYFLKKERVDKIEFDFAVKMTMAPSFGYYGNLSRGLYPYDAFHALEALYLKHGSLEPILTLAGRFRAESFITLRNSIYLGEIPYKNMPHLLDATTAILTNESDLNHCLGSQKVVDAIARGVPVLCKPFDVFVEQLGDDYPCYYNSRSDAENLADRLVNDAEFFREVVSIVKSRRPHYEKASIIRSMQEQFLEAEII